MEDLYPLQFKEIIKTYSFGGRQILSAFPEKNLPDLPCIAESWEVYKESIVSAGPLKGKSLDELCKNYGEQILGSDIIAWKGKKFPLLLKFIDATTTLELGVHPDIKAVEKGLISEGRSKNEAWYVLSCGENCYFCNGMKKKVTKEEFIQAVLDNRVRELVNTFPVKTGDTIYVPGGRIHSIGAKSLVAEIQDNNGDNYFFEWPYDNYTMEEKKKIALESLNYCNLDDMGTGKTIPITLKKGNYVHTYLVVCKYFSLERYDLVGPIKEINDGRHFIILTGIKGKCLLKWKNGEIEIPTGKSILLPACITEIEIRPYGECSLLRSYVPDLIKDIVKPLQHAGIQKERIISLGGDFYHNDLKEVI